MIDNLNNEQIGEQLGEEIRRCWMLQFGVEPTINDFELFFPTMIELFYTMDERGAEDDWIFLTTNLILSRFISTTLDSNGKWDNKRKSPNGLKWLLNQTSLL